MMSRRRPSSTVRAEPGREGPLPVASRCRGPRNRPRLLLAGTWGWPRQAQGTPGHPEGASGAWGSWQPHQSRGPSAPLWWLLSVSPLAGEEPAGPQEPWPCSLKS